MVCTENMFREHVPAGTVPRTRVNARLVFKLDIGICFLNERHVASVHSAPAVLLSPAQWYERHNVLLIIVRMILYTILLIYCHFNFPFAICTGLWSVWIMCKITFCEQRLLNVHYYNFLLLFHFHIGEKGSCTQWVSHKTMVQVLFCYTMLLYMVFTYCTKQHFERQCHTCQHLKVRKRNTRYCEGAMLGVCH